MVCSSKIFPQWKDNIFLSDLVPETVIRVNLQDDKVAGEEFTL